MNVNNFFNLDFDLDLESVIIEIEEAPAVKASPLFSIDDFATWYPSKEVYTYLTSAGIAKTAVKGALRALLMDEDTINYGRLNESKIIKNLFDVVLSSKDLVYYTQKSPRVDCFRPSKSKTMKAEKVALLANLIRNALLGIDA